MSKQEIINKINSIEFESKSDERWALDIAQSDDISDAQLVWLERLVERGGKKFVYSGPVTA